MDNLGVLNRAFISSNNTIVSNPKSYEIDEIDIQVLVSCLDNRISSSEGVSFSQICRSISADQMLLKVSSIKLQRMGFTEVEQYVYEHSNGAEEYLGHKITDLGVDYLLENQSKYKIGSEALPTHSFDDDIAF